MKRELLKGEGLLDSGPKSTVAVIHGNRIKCD